MDETNELVRERQKKLEALRALGIDPFGGKFPKEFTPADLIQNFEDKKKVHTAGRLGAMRFMGKSVFCDLKDETGRIQLYVKKDHLSETDAKVFDLLDIGDLIGVEGELFKTKTGEISVRVNHLQILSKKHWRMRIDLLNRRNKLMYIYMIMPKSRIYQTDTIFNL